MSPGSVASMLRSNQKTSLYLLRPGICPISAKLKLLRTSFSVFSSRRLSYVVLMEILIASEFIAVTNKITMKSINETPVEVV